MILDSGERREFETGAVRDIGEGNGRCDLIPWVTITEVFPDSILNNIGYFIERKDKKYLRYALMEVQRIYNPNTMPDMMLGLAQHFEEGAKKYDERNWEQGIPVHCFIDSAIRHYLKFLRGDTDEHHFRAMVWNLVCCLWTLDNRPEMMDI